MCDSNLVITVLASILHASSCNIICFKIFVPHASYLDALPQHAHTELAVRWCELVAEYAVTPALLDRPLDVIMNMV